MNNPYHEGELEIQKLVGEDELAKRNGQVIKNEILAGALKFIDKQPMIVLGSVASTGEEHWASVVTGSPGFVATIDQKSIELNLDSVLKVKSDPLWSNIKVGGRLGILFIELETRRRLKVNGVVDKHDQEKVVINVEESFPLCPKYIQRRKVDLVLDESLSKEADVSKGDELGEQEKSIFAQCDTAFLVTSHNERGLDVSHRGGKPGFLKVVSNSQIRCPDYKGNSMFNSFGNLVKNPKAGLIAVDFKNSCAVQLTGEAYTELDQDDKENETGGTGRFWTFKIDSWIRQPVKLTQKEFLDLSPFLP